MQIPKRRHEKLQVRDTGPVYLTSEGIQNLKNKLERLKVSLPELALEAKRTADYGDRSENAEYKEAKGRLRGAHRQILAIKDQLKRAVPIKAAATGKVQIGSTVVLEVVNSSLRGVGDEAILQKSHLKTFQIVGPSETDPSRGRISYKSPLGAALLGRAVGESTTIKTPTGSTTYAVVEIK